MDKILLHACCGPCSTACVERLREVGVEPVLFYANDNIDTAEEFGRRLDALRSFAERSGVELVAAPYDHDAWLRDVKGLEGEPEGGRRCDACFRHSFRAAAECAQSRGLDAFTTTLSVSPHKNSARLFAAGHDAERPGCAFLEEDFKKRGGFLRSVRLASEYGLYRQSYCGCEFSRRAASAAKRTGQAVVELVITLLAVLVILGGLLQLLVLAHADTATMAEATAAAADSASTAGAFAESFTPVRDWRPGRDGQILTRDDEEVKGSVAGFRSDIASRTFPAGDSSSLDDASSTDIRSFSELGATASFGFVHARAEQDVEVLPLSGPLFGLRRAQTGNDVWMVKVNDIW